ncbi:chromate efflux transporter [Corallococcus macrosporus]|uniref:Chromate transporter n=1 Tax=Corallococcus macrosporus DSM 14697 TaxID=1189310 RepID=A0A250K009_9BACT|nr:chromate efflux transporter [Corallococcus macrosporus]ATB48696.1 chromate transporter [Corallococcus macrosporus DSM 14697]
MSEAGRVEAHGPPRHGAHGLVEVALLFLRLGFTGFGGPAAHIAMMEDEVVRRRRWLTRDEFLDLLGAANLIPGPNSTELAIHLGHRRGGWPGLLVAGVCFILPAMLITLAAAWAYVRFGSLPSAEGVLYGVKPVIIAVVLQALWGLGRVAVKTRVLAAVGVAAVIASALGVNELLVLLCAGVLMALWRGGTRAAGAGGRQQGPGQMMLGMPLALQGLAAGAAGAVPFSLGGLFLFFVKVGAVLFGSGYVLLAFLRADLVERWGWLTETQLLDAVAVGQVTPGPVFTTATFIGYLLGGGVGAVVATVGIFLPAFFFVAVSGPVVPRLRRSWVAGAVLDGVNVASLALMAVVTWQLGRSALVDAWTVGLALLSAVLLLRFRLNSVWLVLGGALTGLLLRTVGA